MSRHDTVARHKRRNVSRHDTVAHHQRRNFLRQFFSMQVGGSSRVSPAFILCLSLFGRVVVEGGGEARMLMRLGWGMRAAPVHAFLQQHRLSPHLGLLAGERAAGRPVARVCGELNASNIQDALIICERLYSCPQ